MCLSRFLPPVWLALLPTCLFAQEQLGMRLERFSGIYGATINPANTAWNPNNWEVSLFTADLFVENNYAYLRQTSVPQALRHSDNIVSVETITAENPAPADAILLDYFNARRNMRAVAQTHVTGPGGSFRLKEKHVLGFTTALRSEVSSYQIPEILAYRTISDLPRNQAINIPATGVAGMVWNEIGLHYSQQQTDNSNLHTSWGISPKLLLGFEGFYTRALSSFDYTQRLGDTVAFGRANWDYALTTGNTSDETRMRRQGMGAGFDAGFTWAKPSGESATGYAWRLGVSLIDVGAVRFNRNAERHHINFDTLLTVSDTDFPQRDNVSDILQDVSRAFLDDPAASLQGRSFAIGLPTALSVQFDAALTLRVYVSGVWVQRVPLWAYSVKRPNTLAVVPRFEHRWASVSLPVVLSDWRSLRVGAAARLGWLYLGTDNLGSFFKQDKLTGTDFYIGLKINAFSLSFDRGNRLTKERQRGHGRQKRGKIKCYSF
jgi:hypothetical protein